MYHFSSKSYLSFGTNFPSNPRNVKSIAAIYIQINNGAIKIRNWKQPKRLASISQYGGKGQVGLDLRQILFPSRCNFHLNVIVQQEGISRVTFEANVISQNKVHCKSENIQIF